MNTAKKMDRNGSKKANPKKQPTPRWVKVFLISSMGTLGFTILIAALANSSSEKNEDPKQLVAQINKIIGQTNRKRGEARPYTSIVAADLNGKLNITIDNLKIKKNSRGEGMFVYVPQTRFFGVQRLLMWLVIGKQAFSLNGASKNLTPNLKWPREAEVSLWSRTGFDSVGSTSDQSEIVFGGNPD